MRKAIPTLFALLACAPPPACAQVVADFEVDLNGLPWGRFSVVLDHNFSPHAVANFIRLAEGLTPWIDKEGRARTGPFYNGLPFHAGVPDSEVSGGSPSGNGGDGPGYTFRDDFRSPGTPFSIYMENNGPNTNGSRFFINLLATLNPALRPGRYSRFGEVLTATNPPGGNGRLNILAISRGGNSGAYSIDNVTMRYLGTEALAFRFRVEQASDPILSLLPSVRQAQFRFRRSLGSTLLDWDESPGSVLLLWSSPNLRTWTGTTRALNAPGSTDFGLDVTQSIALQSRGFFRGGVADYAQWPSTERPLPRSAVQTNFGDPNLGIAVTTIYSFDVSGRSGTYQSPQVGAGTFEVSNLATTGPSSTQLDLTATSGNLPDYRLTLHYDLAWTSPLPALALPITANPSRLSGANLAAPGTPLVNGQWTYTAAP